MFVKLTNGIPAIYTLGQLRRDNSQTSFPSQIPDEILAEYGMYPCSRSSQPAYDELVSRLADGEFTQEQDSWVLSYEVVQFPDSIAQENIRTRRDELLQESDWIVVKSYERGEAIPQEWLDYRQSLRDVTEQTGFPYSVVWPTKP
jgi:hypothetical protein